MKTMSWVEESLELVWRHKYLWFFGFFAGAAGGGVGGNPGGKGGQSSALEAGGQAIPGWVWPLLGFALVFALGILALHVLSEVALIEGIRRGREGGRLGIRGGLSFAKPYFWRVLGVKVALVAGVTVAAAVIGTPALLGAARVIPLGAGIAGTVLLALVGIPVLLTAYLVYQYALRFVVIDGARAGGAIRSAYAFLHGRLAEALRLLLAVLLGQIGGGLVAGLLLLPGALIGLATYFAAGLVPAVVVGAVLGLPFAFVAIGAMGSFISSLWTLAFLDQRKVAA